MANILIISKNSVLTDEISQSLNEYKIDCKTLCFKDEDRTVNFIKENNFGIIITDDEIENSNILLKMEIREIVKIILKELLPI